MLTASGIGTRRIALVSRGTSVVGGASHVCEETARLLQQAPNIKATHFLRQAEFVLHPWQKVLAPTAFSAFASEVSRSVSSRLGLPEYLGLGQVASIRSLLQDHDVIHIHDAIEAVSVRAMARLAETGRMVVTMHDCSWFTGGCINPVDCVAYRTRCGSCPQLGTWPLKTNYDRTGFLQQERLRVLRAATVIAPSLWIVSMMREAAPDINATVIPNPVEFEFFRPRPRRACREIMGLNDTDFVAVISASSLAIATKGARSAIEALEALKGRVRPLLIGRRSQVMAKELSHLGAVAAGWVRDRVHMSILLNAADVLLYLSVADNSPCTITEAMGCGVPTLAYATGGIPELVVPGKSGWLVPPGNVPAVIETLGELVQTPERVAEMGAGALALAHARHSPEGFVRDHLKLYASVV